MFGFGTKVVRSKLIEYEIIIGGPGGRKKVEMPSKSEIEKVYPKFTIEKAAPKFGIGSTLFLKWLNTTTFQQPRNIDLNKALPVLGFSLFIGWLFSK